MKRLLLITNLLTLALLIFFGIRYYKCYSSPPAPPSACENCCQEPDNTIATGTSQPFSMSREDARNMVGNYTTNHWQTINASHSPATGGCWVDSRSAWFSISRLKGFIKAIEDQSNTVIPNCCDSSLGIRIYFASYNREQIIRFGLDNSYANRHTVLLIPTYKCDGKDHDFNPLYQPETARACCNNDSLQWSGATVMALTTMNHGNIIPPPYPDAMRCTEYRTSGANFLLNVVDPSVNLNLQANCPCNL